MNKNENENIIQSLRDKYDIEVYQAHMNIKSILNMDSLYTDKLKMVDDEIKNIVIAELSANAVNLLFENVKKEK